MKNGVIIIILIFIPFQILSKTIPVGVSPGILDVGEVDRGREELVKFYIVSPSEDPILVNLEKSRIGVDFFSHDKYRSFINNFSEENVLDWVKFINNPVELRRSEETGVLKNGLKSYRDINIILNVPSNAEPGYHILSIIPTPIIASSPDSQISTQMVAITPVRIIFKVPGDAIRDGKILDVNNRILSKNRIAIDIHFINTGSVTISAKAKIKLKNNNSEIINNLNSPTEYVKPGEKKVLTSYLFIDNMKEGTYILNTEVSYTTGISNYTTSLYIKPQSIEEVTAKVSRPFQIKWWIILILILLVYIIYRVLRK